LIFFIPIAPAVIESVFGTLFFLFIVRSAIRRPTIARIRSFFSEPINLTLLIFYILIGFSMFVDLGRFWKCFDDWFFKWGEGVILFYLAQVFLKRKQVKSLIVVFLVSSCLLSIDGIVQKITNKDFLRGFVIVDLNHFKAIRASFNHFNDFGTFLVAMFFLNFSTMLKTKKNWLKPFLAIVCLLVLYNITFTYSRAAWVALGLGSLVFILLYPNRKFQIGAFSFLLIAIFIILLIPQSRSFVESFIERGFSIRVKVWKTALLMFKDTPLFGKGLGSFMHYVTIYGKKYELTPIYAHN